MGKKVQSRRYISVYPAAAKSLQSCPTLCNPIDGSPSGSSVPGTLQARTLEWVAISFSSAWKWQWSFSVVPVLVTPWTVAYQDPPSMGFSRKEYWSGVPLPSAFSLSSGSQKNWYWPRYHFGNLSGTVLSHENCGEWAQPVFHWQNAMIRNHRKSSYVLNKFWMSY